MHRVPHCMAHGSVPQAWLSLPKGCLLPRGHGLGGEWPLVSAQGALLKISILPCKKGLEL